MILKHISHLIIVTIAQVALIPLRIRWWKWSRRIDRAVARDQQLGMKMVFHTLMFERPWETWHDPQD